MKVLDKPFTIKINKLLNSEFNVIQEAVNKLKYDSYRIYQSFSKNNLKSKVFRNCSESSLNKKVLVIAKSRGSISGFACVSDLVWDTGYFGVKMAEVEYLTAEGDRLQETSIKGALLSALMGIAREKKIQCLISKINIDDFSGIHSLENSGFRLMCEHLTYVVAIKHLKIPVFKEYCKIRESRNSDMRDLINLTKTYSPYPSRFDLDSQLPFERSKYFYVEWVKNACKGIFADRVLVAERNGKIVGFFSYQINKEVKICTGINSAHNGLLVVSPEGKGSALSLLKAAVLTKKRGLQVDLAELEAYNYNYPIIKLYQKLGFSLVRSEYIFHKHLS
jgi:L-amino acid N-acyltransferase YncA